jgi:hypothetical protein
MPATLNMRPLLLGALLGSGLGLALFELGFLTVEHFVPVLAVLGFMGATAGGYFVFIRQPIIRELYFGIVAAMSLGLVLFVARIFPMERFITLMIASGAFGAIAGLVAGFARTSSSAL